MIGPGRRLFNNFDEGVADGQMLFWDNTEKKYKYTEIEEMIWDDIDKELGIGSDLPNEPLHVRADFDGNKAIRVQNESLGVSAVARLIIDTSAGSGFFAAYGVNFIESGSRKPDSCNLTASAAMANGIAIVARAATGIIRFYAGGNADGDLQVYITPNGDMVFATKTGALIVSKLTTTERNALTPENGMIIYNTSTNKFQGYENSAWVDLI
jgi:hypothetical protein